MFHSGVDFSRVPDPFLSLLFFFNDTATTEIYTLSLHDALPISTGRWPRTVAARPGCRSRTPRSRWGRWPSPPAVTASSTAATSRRSEEHTSELQSLAYLVCRLLLEKKKKKTDHMKRRDK